MSIVSRRRLIEAHAPMCLVLPARVLSKTGDSAEIELHDGQRISATFELTPDLEPGQFVLVDRGIVLRVIDAEEAETILAIYAEMSAMLEGEAQADSVDLAAWLGQDPVNA